jgi:hypothetical protein
MPIGCDHRLIEMRFAFHISTILCRRVSTLQVVIPKMERSFVLALPSHMTIDDNHCLRQKCISHFSILVFCISAFWHSTFRHFGVLVMKCFDTPSFDSRYLLFSDQWPKAFCDQMVLISSGLRVSRFGVS